MDFWPKTGIFSPFDTMPNQKAMRKRCLGGSSFMWVPKLDFGPKNGQIWPKICICGHFGPNIGIVGPFNPNYLFFTPSLKRKKVIKERPDAELIRNVEMKILSLISIRCHSQSQPRLDSNKSEKKLCEMESVGPIFKPAK